MAKKKVKIEGNTISGDADAINDMLEAALVKPIEIQSATIKEAQCNYGYEIKTGPGAGDKIPNRKGSSFVHEDMYKAFIALNVHLAIIDDAFKYSGEELTSLDDMSSHDITDIFTVTGFKISGSEENEGFVLIGEKFVTNGSIGLETPKMTKSGNYVFFDELKEAVENARTEVELYMNGKAAPKAEQPELPFNDAARDNDNSDFDNPME